LDQFKVVNDTCGHGAGDDPLRKIAAKLSSGLREADALARPGGDEFGILLKGCPLDKARQVAESLRVTVEQFRFFWKNKEFRVGASIGVVAVTEDSGELPDVLSAADSAMYVAKENGRNRVHVFQRDNAAVARRHGQIQWMQRIQSAVEQGSFRLYFQPIISLEPDDVARWTARFYCAW
jgi:diguanylate cyclase (GGDEF)-like protein